MIRKKMKAAGISAAAVLLGTSLILPVAADESNPSLTIDLQNKTNPIIIEQFPNVQYDIYKVADLRWLIDDGINSDGFYYVPKAGYTLPEISTYDALSAEGFEWDKVADKALDQALSGNIVPDDEITDGIALDTPPKVEGLEQGLYMIVAHEKGAESADYKDSKDGKIVTTANSEMYTYYFLPTLISIPTKDHEEGESASSSDPGDWKYDAEIKLKWEAEPRIGSLIIEKTVHPGNTEALEKAATFVYHVTATWKEPGKDEREVFNDYVALYFDGTAEESQQRAIYNRFPLGSKVTVTEVYDGTNYDPVGSTVVEDIPITTDSEKDDEIIEAGQIARFENKSNKRIIYGHGIENTFKYINEGGKWHWEPVRVTPNEKKDPQAAQDEGGTEG